jgi:hypothetical protein
LFDLYGVCVFNEMVIKPGFHATSLVFLKAVCGDGDEYHTVLKHAPKLPSNLCPWTVAAAPHPFAKTKLLALLWCANHEMLHAGQIGLLRRLLGCPPMW